MELYINISRFHPLLVHLPIGILLFAFFMEIYQRWKKANDFDNAIQFALIVGGVAAIASVLTGMSLSNEGGYNGQTLSIHKWMGIGLTVLTFVLYLMKRETIAAGSKFYLGLFSSAIVLLTLTGHFGGNLTHGADYLFTNDAAETVAVTDIQAANVYSTIVEPILKNKCNGCHNPSKAKGELIMTSQEGILKGGKTGQLFDFEQPDKSEFLARVHLPLEEKEHMPPKGKKQLEGDEIALLTWWIENEACFDCLVKDTEGKEKIEPLLKKYETTETNLAGVNVKPISSEMYAKLLKAGVRVDRNDSSPLVDIDLANHQGISKSLLKKIKKIGKNVVSLHLGGSNFSDAHSSIFKHLPHLQKVQLQQTQITDKTIAKLKKLKYLESLNVYQTAVTDASLKDVARIKTLQQFFAWQSKISPKAIADFQKSKPLLQVQYQFDEDLFGKSELSPPSIVADNQLFNDKAIVTFEINFRNATIYYTLDGSDPDSTSMVFEDSLILTQSTRVKAIAFKEGWGSSTIASKQFIKTSQKLANVKLDTKPNDKYSGNGAKSLFDLEKGTTSFVEPTWLGFEGQHFTATVELEKLAEIETVFVSALASPGSWIFYPQGFKVEVSENGQQFTTVYDKMTPTEDESLEVGLEYFDIHFPKTKAKFIKVKVFSMLKNPDWHPNPGGNSWLFVDEIMVD